MNGLRTETHLFSIHSSPVSEEWLGYAEYVAKMLGSTLHYCDGDVAEARSAAGQQDVILLYEPAPPRWRQTLGWTLSERLAGRGPASVLVARQPRWPINDILLLFRGEPTDEVAIAWTLELARPARATVIILPILPPIPALYTSNREGRPSVGELLAANTPCTARLRRLLAQFESRHIAVTVRLGTGDPVWQMRGEMAEREYDLVVVGADPAGRFYRFLVGDLVHPLLCCASCPVLVARNTPQLSRKWADWTTVSAGGHMMPWRFWDSIDERNTSVSGFGS